MDRLTRDYYDGVELERFVSESGKKIISLSEPVDFGTPYGRFMFRVKLAMNSFYVENLIDKIRMYCTGRDMIGVNEVPSILRRD